MMGGDCAIQKPPAVASALPDLLTESDSEPERTLDAADSWSDEEEQDAEDSSEADGGTVKDTDDGSRAELDKWRATLHASFREISGGKGP